MNYVMSDIHGRYDKYIKMLEAIQFTSKDTLYVIGDVIDRNPDGMEILLDMMERENVIYLRGNHEQMMLDAFEIQKELEEDPSPKVKELFKKRWNHWLMSANGGLSTLEKIEKLSVERVGKVQEYVARSYLAIPDICIGDKHYYLCHALFSRSVDPLRKEPIKQEDVTRDDLMDMIWERFPADEFLLKYGDEPAVKGKLMIIGHTPTGYFKDADYDEKEMCRIFYGDGFIGIDCGCANEDKYASLGCLRLEDGKEFYV